MGLLTDTDIRKVLCVDKDWIDKTRLHIFPFEEECLTPVGYDLRVGSKYASAMDADIHSLEPGRSIEIRPGDTMLITTLEDVGMPQNRTISAFITSKVSQVSRGLSHISTNIDPDWHGELLIALHNPSRNVIALALGDSFCTINFIENRSPATKESGKEPGRKDILLKQFVTNSRAYRARESGVHRRYVILNAFLRFATIVCFGGAGLLFFGPTPGAATMAAMGVGLATIINIGRK